MTRQILTAILAIKSLSIDRDLQFQQTKNHSQILLTKKSRVLGFLKRIEGHPILNIDSLEHRFGVGDLVVTTFDHQ
jgi:hypothetical protein